MKTPQEQAEEIDVKIDLCGGKYTYIRYKNGGQECLRYREEWRNLTGDNLVYWLVVELLQARSAPLPELIAVALAAGELWQIPRPSRYDYERVGLGKALEALRATARFGDTKYERKNQPQLPIPKHIHQDGHHPERVS